MSASNVSQRVSRETKVNRRLPIGAELQAAGGVHFRVWAPGRSSIDVVPENGSPIPMTAEPDGYFSAWSESAEAGMRYRFRVDGGDSLFPDPASRYQPEGPHGPSEVVDSESFTWSDQAWRGVPAAGQVLYEMHIGTFTPQGTWAAAQERLEELKDLGITCLEVMPINEFAGRWGWGYDGVDLFAPYHHYGTPDDVRRFIDRAHVLGMGVILDVVYNHLGPDGNYLRAFTDAYFSATHMTDWGEALNFDGVNAGGVREYFLANARYWIEEFHFDGFRFDATQAIVDDSPHHILSQITDSVREIAGDRSLYLINENEPQLTKLVRPTDQHGYGMNALWNDDFHHAAMVVLAGHNEAYYTDYLGFPQEFISSAKYGYLYQGQRYRWQKRRRGTPALDLPPTAFVNFLQNHDQVANSARGYRAHQLAGPNLLRAMTAMMLLMPQTPMLFQGQEWCATTPFLYFADHNPELTKLICKGRAKEISQFPSAAIPDMQACLDHPGARESFEQCRLNHDEKRQPLHARSLQMHRDLLRLRREDPTFRRVQRRGDVDGAVLGHDALVLRFFGDTIEGDRIVLVNLGVDLTLDPVPEPLLAPPLGLRWQQVFSSEDPCYGGSGSPPVDTELEGWHLHGRCCVVCKAAPPEQASVATRHRVAGSAQEAKLKQERLDDQRRSEKERTS